MYATGFEPAAFWSVAISPYHSHFPQNHLKSFKIKPFSNFQFTIISQNLRFFLSQKSVSQSKISQNFAWKT